jgi:hypothetical protein
MPSRTNKMISDFRDKPETDACYRAIDDFVMALGQVKKEARAQVSYAVNRKFLWLWAYEETADGTLYLNVTLDHAVDDPNVHRITQTSANRWNHHVEVKSSRTAESSWLKSLISKGFEFARK